MSSDNLWLILEAIEIKARAEKKNKYMKMYYTKPENKARLAEYLKRPEIKERRREYARIHSRKYRNTCGVTQKPN